MRCLRNRQESVMSSYFTDLFQFLFRVHSYITEHVLDTNWNWRHPPFYMLLHDWNPPFFCSFLHSLITNS